MNETIISYAQNREDLILAGFFEPDETGFYVDVGAFHPTEDSVTKYFYDRNWHGINIEPNSDQFASLVAERPRDTNLNVGIGDKKGELKLRVYETGEGLSTFSDTIKAEHTKKPSLSTNEHHDISVPVTTLATVFAEQKVKTISFLKVDVEGYEYQVLAGNDWKNYRPEVICVEAIHIVEDWRPLLKEAGYKEVFFDGLNAYYVSNEAVKRAKNFSYAQAVLGRPVLTPGWEEEIRRRKALEQASEGQQLQIQSMHKLNSKLERQVEIFHSQLHEQSRLKNLVKSLVLKIDSIILRHLSKLTKKPHYYPAVHIPSSVADDPEKILEILHEADAKSFAGTPSVIWKVATFFGNGIYQSYYWSRRLAFRLLKPVWKLIRRVK